MDIQYLIEIIAAAFAVILVFTPHEFAHAFVATKCGDATPKLNGRLTLNPIKHIDAFGFILCVFAGFGWAKPVPINPNNFNHYRRGLFFTSIAGVIANYIVAFLIYPLALVVWNYALFQVDSQVLYYLVYLVYNIFLQTYVFSLCIFIFNLLPLYPLDGFRILESATRYSNPVQRFFRVYGNYILSFLILESFVCSIAYRYTGIVLLDQLNILGYVMRFAVDYLGYPIYKFWGLFL